MNAHSIRCRRRVATGPRRSGRRRQLVGRRRCVAGQAASRTGVGGGDIGSGLRLSDVQSNYGLQPTVGAPSWWTSCSAAPLRAAGG